MILCILFIGIPSFAQYSDPTQDPDLILLKNNPNQIRNVPLVLTVMQRYGVPDINEDGKVDCIDYSIWFRMLYGSNARIIINNNPKNGRRVPKIRCKPPACRP